MIGEIKIIANIEKILSNIAVSYYDLIIKKTIKITIVIKLSTSYL